MMQNFIKEHKDLLSTLLILVSAPLLAWLLTVFVFQSYVVEGSSMETTMHNKDRLIVVKYKKTFSRITTQDYIPKRYDIIVFNHKDAYSLGAVESKQLIKRVIGLPGDKIVIKEGLVTIYNKDNPEGFSIDREGPEKNTTTVSITSGSIDETVGEGEVFVLGDNRSNSLDSRVFGTVPESDIVGKATFRIYPFGKTKHF